MTELVAGRARDLSLYFPQGRWGSRLIFRRRNLTILLFICSCSDILYTKYLT